MISAMKRSFWYILIGRASIWSVLVTYFIISSLFSFAVIELFKLIDSGMAYVLIKTFSLAKSNPFVDHSFSLSLNVILSFLFADIMFDSFKKKNETKSASDKMLFQWSVGFFILFMLCSVITVFNLSLWLGVQMFIAMMLSVLINAIHEKCGKFLKAVDLKIDIDIANQINNNLRDNGFHTFINSPINPPDNVRSIIIQCKPEVYDDFHILLMMYSTNVQSCKMLIHFIKDRKLRVNKEMQIINKDDVVVSQKDFLKDFYDYVSDSKRLNSKNPIKEFLGL